MSRKKKTTADTKAKSEKKYYDYNEKDGMWVYYGRNEIAFWGAIVLSVIIMGIAAGIHYICYGSYALYKDAPYHLETDATVINVEEFKKEKEVNDPYYKDADPQERKKHKKTQSYTVYVIDWEFEVNGEKFTFQNSEQAYTSKKVGDVEKVPVYSNDGVEYKKAGFSEFTNLIYKLCRLVCIILILFLIRIIIEWIRQTKWRKEFRASQK